LIKNRRKIKKSKRKKERKGRKKKKVEIFEEKFEEMD